MIRIRRGREPAKLRPIRRAALANARAHHAAGTLDKVTLGIAYQIVKDDLCAVQHFKCCYCERNNIEPSHNDVEHYRPKLSADRGAGFPNHGYWWLAWTWQNLMFACPNCNRTEKNDVFPLAAGSVALVHEQRPPGSELALLIDPCVENPIGHIKFQYHPALPKHKWRPLPKNGSARGDRTNWVLGLDRPSLLDLYDRRVRDYLEPIIMRLNVEIALNNQRQIDSIWANEALPWVVSNRPFTALSYDALDYYVPITVRHRFSISLSRPT